MFKKTKNTIAVILAAAVTLTCIQPADVHAGKKEWYEDVEFNIPQNIELTNGSRRTVPAVEEPASFGLKKAASVPSAYMNTLAQVTEKYPGTRDQGLFETCWAFSAIGLAEFDMINDGMADKTIDLSELQHVYFSYHNAEDVFGGTYGDSLGVSGGDYRQAGGNLYGKYFDLR